MVTYQTAEGELKTVSKADLQDSMQASEKLLRSLNETWEEKMQKVRRGVSSSMPFLDREAWRAKYCLEGVDGGGESGEGGGVGGVGHHARSRERRCQDAEEDASSRQP